MIIRLISVGPPDKNGCRTISYDLNGVDPETFIIDKTIVPKPKVRPKADLADVTLVAAPVSGFIATLSVQVGSKSPPGQPSGPP